MIHRRIWNNNKRQLGLRNNKRIKENKFFFSSTCDTFLKSQKNWKLWNEKLGSCHLKKHKWLKLR